MEKTIEQLEEVNKKLDTIIGIMKIPENRAVKVLELIATVAGVLSILGIIDVLRNWLKL
jgi:hypothetical protein